MEKSPPMLPPSLLLPPSQGNRYPTKGQNGSRSIMKGFWDPKCSFLILMWASEWLWRWLCQGPPVMVLLWQLLGQHLRQFKTELWPVCALLHLQWCLGLVWQLQSRGATSWCIFRQAFLKSADDPVLSGPAPDSASDCRLFPWAISRSGKLINFVRALSFW